MNRLVSKFWVLLGITTLLFCGMAHGQSSRNPKDPISSAAGKIVLNGQYQAKNIYIQNPFAGTGGGFCVQRVFVNEKEIPFDSSNAFEIDLKSMGFQVGDPIKITITHKDDCKPKVLTDNSKPQGAFDLVSMECSPEGLLKWVAKNELNPLMFTVQQYRWNKWVKVGEVESKRGVGENLYELKIVPHSGENLVRIKKLDYTSHPCISKPVSFVSTTPEIKIEEVNKIKREIVLSAETLYELYDKTGNIVKRGFASTIDCSDLSYGKYYLNYDNKTGDINLRKQRKE